MERRDFMKTAAVGAAGVALSGTSLAAGGELVLQNVKALVGGEFKKCDIGITAGRITSISSAGSLSGARTLECEGKYASPGWVDIHTHYVTRRHGKFIGTSVDKLGIPHGVTALADAGTCGPGNFHRTVKAGLDDPRVTSKGFCYITTDGIKVRDYLWYKKGWEDVDGVARIKDQYPDKVCGIKFRADHTVTPKDDRTYYVRKCREAGDLTGLPVMIHIGAPPPTLTDILVHLKEGDIITHCFRGPSNTLLDGNGKLLDSVKDARERGVRFDVGHGVGSFTFDSAKRALDQGFDDFSISSDLYMLSTPSKARTFGNVLTQFMALGMPLEDIMMKASEKPAKVLGIERGIKENAEATITVFSVESGDFECVDVKGGKRKSGKRIVPEWTVIKGEPYQAGERDRKIFF